MLILCDGFENYGITSTADPVLLSRWTSSSGWLGVGAGASLGALTVSPRTGVRALRVIGTGVLYRGLSAAEEHITLTAGMAYAGSPDGVLVLAFGSDTSNTTHITVRISFVSRMITVFRGSITGTLLATVAIPDAMQAGGWNYVEAKVTLSSTVGVVQVRINETSVVSLSSANTRNAGTKTVLDAITYTGTSTIAFDDMYIVNGSGTVNADFLGDVRVRTLVPSGVGTYAELTPTGTAINWQNVDEMPPSATDFNSSATDNTRDSYALSDLPSTSGTVLGIQIGAFVAKSDTGLKKAATFIRSGAVDTAGVDQTLSTSFAYIWQNYDINPGTGLAWTPSEINALEAGIRVRP